MSHSGSIVPSSSQDRYTHEQRKRQRHPDTLARLELSHNRRYSLIRALVFCRAFGRFEQSRELGKVLRSPGLSGGSVILSPLERNRGRLSQSSQAPYRSTALCHTLRARLALPVLALKFLSTARRTIRPEPTMSRPDEYARQSAHAAEPHAGSASEDGQAVALALPRRSKPTHSAVWSLSAAPASPAPAPSDGQTTTPVPVTVCDKHNRPDRVCCRELKGDDERTLVDPAVVRDVIIGLSDGLTVPFALTAGLASLGSSKLVVVGGLAEIISGSISMGIGGFLASEAERDHFRYLRKTTQERVKRSCAGEMEREVHEVLGPVGIDQSLSRRVASALAKVETQFDSSASEEDSQHTAVNAEPSMWRHIMKTLSRSPKSALGDTESANGNAKLRFEEDVGLTAFLLKFGEGLEDVPDSRLYISALTIGAGYAVGGLIPMIPYFFEANAKIALIYSIIVTAIILLVFGAFKAYYTGAKIGFFGYLRASVSTFLVGGLAAAASFGIVRALEGGEGSDEPTRPHSSVLLRSAGL
ncbi:uncharacterized protein L969DRAFT_91836 [Mixia osmundae IAM 14324]|uniref:DUF125-domain-containing protein n=1 Tax=Mixia osmundae (strain CBS 9802 / IAM 14324 / JCM 22182 / KY 12970) TaxID=764103 RepID=G7E859_MIXOS|nr:uncharacterized protein L969DRAFT_91836 [Mixia osmundae IAM 14324]KEI42389.1 hypothetical protein L969DRAFT_91836 [Mixia osmundae IAM 14324]GAA99019.1 hypothetical protein E5Q_05708 [Mixia osmundae IAM 14324]